MTLRSFPGSFDLTFEQCHSTKGQLISKCLFGIFNSTKKRTKKTYLSTMVPQVELFSFVFSKNWRHQKDISKLTDLYKDTQESMNQGQVGCGVSNSGVQYWLDCVIKRIIFVHLFKVTYHGAYKNQIILDFKLSTENHVQTNKDDF